MRKGSIHVVGYEDLLPSNLLNVVPVAGMLQAMAVSLFIVYSGTLVIIGGIVFWLFIFSWGVFAISAAVLAVARWRRIPPGQLDLRYENGRDEGGALKLSYTVNADGKERTRTSIVAKEVKAFPNRPMSRIRVRIDLPVSGTKSSIDVIFEKPKIFLELGFPSAEEMNSAYELLK